MSPKTKTPARRPRLRGGPEVADKRTEGHLQKTTFLDGSLHGGLWDRLRDNLVCEITRAPPKGPGRFALGAGAAWAC
jgi:hypothetical protein